MRVLSLFDGMSCGRIALERSGIDVETYYASEIDKFAMAVAQHNYPDTIQLGDVKDIDGRDLPKIDLLIGGSPCQGFSSAGKQLNFDAPRSALFFEYVRILKELREKNPNIKFMLENVRMKKEHQDVISKYLSSVTGVKQVEPIKINSALVSAQNRVRLYWTNIKGIEQPEDRGIVLRDIIEDGVVDRDKSYCVDANYFKGGNLKSYFKNCRRQLVFAYGLEEGRRLRDGKNLSRNYREGYRVYSMSGKAATLTSSSKGGKGGYSGLYCDSIEGAYRKLSVTECERLQTVPNGYTLVPWGKRMMSNTQRYKMLGNGWTVDVIAHIFKNL